MHIKSEIHAKGLTGSPVLGLFNFYTVVDGQQYRPGDQDSGQYRQGIQGHFYIAKVSGIYKGIRVPVYQCSSD